MKLITAILLVLIAFGTIWTAYESHIANIGVIAWQHQFEEIRQPDGPMDNHGVAPTKPAEPPVHDESLEDYPTKLGRCIAQLSNCHEASNGGYSE